MTVGYVVLAAGLVGTGFAQEMAGFVVATVVWSVGDLLLLGHVLTAVGRIAPEQARGRKRLHPADSSVSAPDSPATALVSRRDEPC